MKEWETKNLPGWAGGELGDIAILLQKKNNEKRKWKVLSGGELFAKGMVSLGGFFRVMGTKKKETGDKARRAKGWIFNVFLELSCALLYTKIMRNFPSPFSLRFFSHLKSYFPAVFPLDRCACVLVGDFPFSRSSFSLNRRKRGKRLIYCRCVWKFLSVSRVINAPKECRRCDDVKAIVIDIGIEEIIYYTQRRI